MKSWQLVGFLLASVGFVLVVFWLLFSRFEALKNRLSHYLQHRALSTLDISSFHAQKALSLATGHVVAVVLMGLLAYLLTRNLFWAVATCCFAYFMPSKWYALQRKKRRKRIEAELPDALLFIASALRAGSALSVALQILVRDQKGPLGEEFSVVLKEQRLGLSFDDAIQNMSQRIQIPDFVLVVVALRVAKEVGGNLSEPLQQLAETLRKKAILEGRISALTAQGRIQGIVMTMFPVVLMAILYFMQPTMNLLFVTPIGWAVLSVMIVMLTLGYFSIQKIVAIDI